jgi:hypothetical protein
MVSCLCGIRFPVCAKSAAYLHSVIFDVYYLLAGSSASLIIIA